MTTFPLATPHHPSLRGAHRTPLVWALVSTAALVLVSVWPTDRDGPSSLFALSALPALPGLSALSGPSVPSSPSAHPAATADTAGLATAQTAATVGWRDPSLPVAAEALAGQADDDTEPPPTF